MIKNEKRRIPMNAIDDLTAEHEAVRRTLDILKKIGQEIDETGRIASPDHVEQLFDFFTTFVDRCHHGKEEELLFPALEEAGISRDGGPMGVMLKEHQQGRDLVAGMRAALARYRDGDRQAARVFRQYATDYVSLLDFHIDKENKVLFPMARKHLPPQKLDEIKTGFDRIETDRIGEGQHEALHAMLDALGRTYLG
jgi:hemerythrin-like domain-containing protein